MFEPHPGYGAITRVASAQQAVAPSIVPAAPQSCPVCAHCPSLPSSDSAFKAVSGDPSGWLDVAATTLLRAALVGVGIAAYDAISENDNPNIVGQAIAGAVGIEIFVLGWTWLNAPRLPIASAVTAPSTVPTQPNA